MNNVKNTGIFCSMILLCLFASDALAGVSFTNIFRFPPGGPYGGQPHSQLVIDKEGNLYGTTELGGQNWAGTVFKMSPEGQIIWSASLDGQNGADPESGLVQDDAGFLYGTAFFGGRNGCGTIFKISADGKFFWSASFDGTNGAFPEAALIPGFDGNLYGTTTSGGAYGFGTVFKVNRGGRITTIYSFTGYADGARPVSGLVACDDGCLYGTTSRGGLIPAVTPPGVIAIDDPGFGTIFKITPRGILTVLHSFGAITNAQRTSLDGAWPMGDLTLGSDNNFYGTTLGGGMNNAGTAFKMAPDGSIIWTFSFGITNGIGPEGKLVQGANGNFYGTTLFGGENTVSGYFGVLSVGTILEITPDGVLTTLYSFGSSVDRLGTPLDGAFPCAGLTPDSTGNFFGTTAGGFFSPGTVFKLSIQ